jgi:hypothetical protein
MSNKVDPWRMSLLAKIADLTGEHLKAIDAYEAASQANRFTGKELARCRALRAQLEENLARLQDGPPLQESLF